VGAFEGVTLGDRLRAHFGHDRHLYGALTLAMANDWDAGGVTRSILAGWEDAPGQSLPQLRLLAGLFRILLRGEAPELAAFYPCLGGARDHRDAWPVARAVMAAYSDELRAALRETPQTNEVGRALALLVGLSYAVRASGLRRVRLLEPGASGGLTMLVDRIRFEGSGWAWGPVGSPLVLSGCGAPGLVPEAFEVVARRGCDLNPVDASTPEGAAYLTSFVWPWHLDRHDRLRAALRLAAEHPVRIDAAPASTWVREQLEQPAPEGVLTVVWHSVTRIYWPPVETEAMTAAVDEARSRMPIAHVAMEHPWDGSTPDADAGALPVIEVDGVRVGHCGHHGPPVVLDGGLPR